MPNYCFDNLSTLIRNQTFKIVEIKRFQSLSPTTQHSNLMLFPHPMIIFNSYKVKINSRIQTRCGQLFLQY
ncbi:hypothetical protein QE152_g32224 [Popillia japonica]|uniref:Uncharacterized protein n=1 Tax=Popillia japonica TaxID=7064 RepID=A0AAW1J010_POPJA